MAEKESKIHPHEVCNQRFASPPGYKSVEEWSAVFEINIQRGY